MIDLDHESKTPLYQQIYAQLCEEMFSGATPAGSKLPPIRTLAADLQVSRNTVEAAYAQLTQEGFVAAHPGSGYVVQKVELMSKNANERRQAATEDFEHNLIRNALWKEKDDPAVVCQKKKDIWFDFTYGDLPAGSFPAHTWRKLTNEVLSTSDINASATYTNPLGERGLREQIAHYLQLHRGVHCHPAQVIIQPGTQGSLYNLLTLFDPLHDIVAMEEPGYDGTRVVFENMRFRLCPIPMLAGEREHIDAYYASHARLAYVTPSNQFPTGRVLQLTARQALLNWARGTNAYLIEDDYCCEYRYNTRPMPSLQSLDHYSRVIYMGTFSKALSPSLRINYLVLPPDLLHEWNSVFAKHYPEVPWLNQTVLEAFMSQGHWERHIRKARAANKRKYLLLKSSLLHTMGERVSVMENGSGLHLMVSVRDGREQNELLHTAQAHYVRVYDTNRYWMAEKHPLESTVLMGFSAIEEKRIAPGVERLAEAWFG